MSAGRGFRLVVLAVTTAVALFATRPADGQSRPAGRLTVAAAADLQAAFPALAAAFERESGITVTASFGSSGNFFAQIQNGAPFDALLSADIDYPRQLLARGLGEKDSLTEYATGYLVIWTRKDSGIDVSRGLRVLTGAGVRRIAIANPKHAPYGRAAQAALVQGGVYDAVQGKLVIGENISQTAQLADSGNAQVALLALSLALSPALKASGTYAEIPAGSYPPIEQAAVVLSASANKPAARAFLAFLTRPEAQQVLERFGFAPPAGPGR